jgi:COMPASS component SWD3
LLLSVAADGYLLIHDIRQNKIIQKILAHPEPLTGVDISHDSTLICTSAFDGYVRLWDLHRMTCVKTITSETGGTHAVSVLKLIGDHVLIGNMNA